MKLRYILIPLVLFGVWLFLDVYTSRRLENEIARLRAAGELQTFEEYAADALEPAEGEGRVTRFLFELHPDRVVHPGGNNLACQLDERGMLRVDADQVWNNWSPQMEADCRAMVEANRPLLDEVHALMALEPDPPEVVRHFAVRDVEGFRYLKIPDLAVLRSVTNVFVLDATLAAKAGDVEAWTRNVASQIQMAVRLAPMAESFIMLIISDNLVNSAVSLVTRGARDVGLDKAQGDLLQRELGQWQVHESLASSLKRERQVFLDMAMPALHDRTATLQRPLRFMIANDLYVGTGLFEEAIVLAIAPYREYEGRIVEWAKRTDSLNWTTPISAMVLPHLARTRGQLEETISRVAQATIEIALNRYRAVHATYPDTLNALVPEFLDAVPVLPQTGEPPEYTASAGDYELIVLRQTSRD